MTRNNRALVTLRQELQLVAADDMADEIEFYNQEDVPYYAYYDADMLDYNDDLDYYDSHEENCDEPTLNDLDFDPYFDFDYCY